MNFINTIYKDTPVYNQSLKGDDPAKNPVSKYQREQQDGFSNIQPEKEGLKQAISPSQEARLPTLLNLDSKENTMFFTHKEGDPTSFFNALPFGMAIITSSGNIEATNEAFLQLSGYTQEELTEKNIIDLLSSETVTDSEYSVLHSIINSEGSSLEKKLTTKDGNTLCVLVKTTVFKNHSGEPHKLILQFVDISDRKEFEELLQKRNEQLEKANQELDRFVYSTSHDLRAPLRSILGLIYIMQHEADPVAQKTYLEMMRSSVNRMDAFIKEIVELSRNSMQDVKIEKVDFPALVSETFESLRFIPGAEKIQFSVEVDQNAEFNSDESRLRIILNNLIANAVTYHNFNQDDPFIKVQATIRNKFAIIEVLDNGRGIKKEHQEKIFDMFYRASEDTKGSGLGLFIVKEAIAKLKGSIRLKSKWGSGTKFSIKLLNSSSL
ncbi:PAS domain S-box protein [Rhodocytophaga rosea]|uniref:histidine kinase n=1 Tax=Rhodocytophaga rosea TaxID=2704465 RepID=A0A6C0GQG8_9BACT|nr:HAMP domain-containing sensor histidine kinase [Rhodocytophaga rosea]QHT70104.1 PAS domain S-box protein [Rhodocytophaga rosea]